MASNWSYKEVKATMAKAKEAIEKAHAVIGLQRDIQRACQEVCPHEEIRGEIPYHDVSNIILKSCKACEKRLGSITNRRYCKTCNKKEVSTTYQTGGKWLCTVCKSELPTLIGKHE